MARVSDPFRLAFSLVMVVAVLALIPLFAVGDRLGYFVVWATTVTLTLVVFLIAKLQLNGRVGGGRAQATIYVIAVAMAASLGMAIYVLRH